MYRMRLITVTSASLLGLLIATGFAAAQQLSFDINRITDSGVGQKIGTATVSEAKQGGVSFRVAATGLPQGQRGFHVHEKGDCGPAMKDGKMTAGLAAGAHYDPAGAKSHKGPKGQGHKGDLPALNATAKGIDQTVTAPHLKLSDVRGRALVIHEGGDNYTDQPENGGGKGRIACGIIPKG
jgi:superoxide dismutase, Cu-Zn family